MVILINLLFQSVSGPGALLPLSVSGPGAVSVLCVGPPGALCVAGGLCVGARRSLREGPALCVIGARHSVSGGPALFVTGPARGAALFVPGPALFLCRAPALSMLALSVSERSPFCVRPQRFMCRARRSLCRGPALCVWPRRSLCWGPRSLRGGPALCVIGARRSVYRGPALFVSGPGTAVSERSPFCVRPQHFMCRARRSVPGARRSLCRTPTSSLSVSGTSTFSQLACSSDPRPRAPAQIRMSTIWSAVCRSACHPVRAPPTHQPQLRSACHRRPAPSSSAGPQLRSACHPSSPERSLLQERTPKPYCLRNFVSALSVPRPGALSGFGDLYFGARRFLSGPGSLCLGPALSVESAFFVSLCVRPRRSPAVCVSRPQGLCVGSM